ncbi:MAG: hypothetical protein RL591_1991, partial [Planctomycetota bacterium]
MIERFAAAGAVSPAATIALAISFMWTTRANAAPPRFFARPVEGVVHLCQPSNPASVAPFHGIAIANDGRVACVAQCGSTTGGARPFVVAATGEVVAFAFGTFTFATPAGFRPNNELLLLGDWCPPVTGACTTAVATTTALPSGNVSVLASSSASASIVNDAEETGWAVGWGATSVTGAWRVRPDGIFESLALEGGSGIDACDVSPTGTAAGSAYVAGALQAVRWNATSFGTILPPLKAGLPTQAFAVGLDGTAAGVSGGRAVWWY